MQVTLGKRFSKAAKRTRKLRFLVAFAGGGRTNKLFTAGVLPLAAFGSEVLGLSGSDVGRLHRMAKTFVFKMAMPIGFLDANTKHPMPGIGHDVAPYLRVYFRMHTIQGTNKGPIDEAATKSLGQLSGILSTIAEAAIYLRTPRIAAFDRLAS